MDRGQNQNKEDIPGSKRSMRGYRFWPTPGCKGGHLSALGSQKMRFYFLCLQHSTVGCSNQNQKQVKTVRNTHISKSPSQTNVIHNQLTSIQTQVQECLCLGSTMSRHDLFSKLNPIHCYNNLPSPPPPSKQNNNKQTKTRVLEHNCILWAFTTGINMNRL